MLSISEISRKGMFQDSFKSSRLAATENIEQCIMAFAF